MLVLGLDIAQTTGFAYFDTKSDLKTIRAGTLKATGDNFEEKAATLGYALMKLIRDERPDFIGIEQPLRTMAAPRKVMKFMGEDTEEKASGSGINAVISSNALIGSASGVIGCFRIPFTTIAPVTWRKSFLGYGTQKGFQRKDWKRVVRERCAQLRIHVTNDDQADAVGVAFAAAGTQMFKMIELKGAA